MAETTVLAAVALEAALLIAVGLLFDVLIPDQQERPDRRIEVFAGSALGITGILVMALPRALELDPGSQDLTLPVVASTGAIALTLAGLFLGRMPTAVATVIMGAYLAWTGGMVALALPAGAAIGVGAAHWCRIRPTRPGLLGLWMISLAATAVSVLLAWVAAQNAPSGASSPTPIALVAILAVMPLAGAALGRILVLRLQRRSLVQQLADERRRLRLAVEAGNLGMYEVDLSTGRVTANARFMEQLGEPSIPRVMPIDEVLLRVQADDRALLGTVMEGYRTGARREHRTELRAITPDGHIATILSVGRRVEEGAADVSVRIAGVHTDLTEERARAVRADEINAERARLLADSDAARRALLSLVEDLRLAQQTQQETLEQYRALIAHSPVAIMVNRSGRIALVNEACVRLLGLRDEVQIVGRSVLEIFDPADHERIIDRIAVIRGERRVAEPREYWITRPDGTKVAVEVSASPFDDQGDVSIHVVLRDITEQKRAAMDLLALNAELEARVRERTSELEHAYGELESFSYSVSHDLRAPLRAITGFAQILNRRYREQLDETGQHYLDNIATAGERMGALIEDLLGYSRVGRRDVRREPLDVGAATDAVMVTLSPRIIDTGASVGIEGDLAMPLGDPTLFQQVLLNLIANALVYARPEVPPAVTVRSVAAGEMVEVSVQDNGIGIAPEHHERVFEVFARLHTEDEIAGTGIGLAIVRKAARLMEGEVLLESTPGEGSRFTLRLPAAPSETLRPLAATSAVEARPAAGAQRRSA